MATKTISFMLPWVDPLSANGNYYAPGTIGRIEESIADRAIADGKALPIDNSIYDQSLNTTDDVSFNRVTVSGGTSIIDGGTGQTNFQHQTDTANSTWIEKLIDAGGSPYTWDDRGSAITVHYDDVDNYIWRSTLGTEIMRKDNAGLHIGATAGSGRKFSVTNLSTAEVALFTAPTTGGQITIYRGSSYGWDVGIDGASNFFIQPDGGSDYFTITPSGTIGVNEAAPSSNAKVHITAASGHLYLEESDASADNKVWTFQANGELFQLQTRTDAYGFLNNVLNVDRNGQFRSELGSAAAPTYSFDGDTDTGVFRATTNELGVATAGVERTRWHDNGFVSVGTSLQGSGLFHVRTTGAIVAEFQRDDNGQILELDGLGYSAHHTLDGGAYLIGHNSGSRGLALQTNSTTRLYVAPDGDVMVGTTSQSGAFAVYDNSGDYHINVVGTDYPAELRLAGGGSGYVHASVLMESSVGVRGQGVYMLNSANGSEWFFGSPYNNSDTFSVTRNVTGGHVDSTADQANSLFSINSAGKVTVFGRSTTVGAQIEAISSGYSDFTPALNTAYSSLVVKGNNNGYAGISIASPNSGAQTGALLFVDTVGNTQGGFVYSHANDHLQMYANGIANAVLTDDGLFGVGTTGPAWVGHFRKDYASSTYVGAQNEDAAGQAGFFSDVAGGEYFQWLQYSTGYMYLQGNPSNSMTMGTISNVPLYIKTNNVVRQTIQADGQSVFANHVTVGTYANPRFYVANSAGVNSTFAVGADSGAVWSGSTTNSPYDIYTNGSSRIRAAADGRVSVGSTTTAGKFHVTLDTSASFGNSWSSSWAAFGGSSSTSGALGFAYDDTNGGKVQVLVPGSSWKPLDIGASELKFTRSGSSLEFHIDSSGRIIMPNLPTSLPGISDVLWNDGGTVKIS